MSVSVESRIPEIAAHAEASAHDAVAEAVTAIADGARLNMISRGSVKTGRLLASIHGETEAFEGEVSAGSPAEPRGVPFFVELGTGARGAAYEFPGKPEGVTYDMTWLRGIPKGEGFAFLITALEAEREPFEMHCGAIYR